MTTQELKNGTPFIYGGQHYKLHQFEDKTYSILRTNGMYVANIVQIGSKIIKAYTYVMDQRVNISIHINDCKEVTE